MTEPRECLLVGLDARATGALLPTIREAHLPLRVAAVVDLDPSTPARVRELAAADLVDHDVPVFTALDEALHGPAGYDIAIVACPHDQHQETALRLLRAGVAVWKEKPFAVCLDDAVELAVHARSGLRVLTQRPHSQLYAHVERALTGMGPLLSYRVRVSRPTLTHDGGVGGSVYISRGLTAAGDVVERRHEVGVDGAGAAQAGFLGEFVCQRVQKRPRFHRP